MKLKGLLSLLLASSTLALPTIFLYERTPSTSTSLSSRRSTQNTSRGITSSTTVKPTTNQTTQKKPFYLIAHRVLMDYGIRAAISHGANAIEIDMYAWKDAWYASHDPLKLSRGHTAEVMFQIIAEEVDKGANILFVWLDMKNPDYCHPEAEAGKWKHCSVVGLRELAREWLAPRGIRVLYGFYGDTLQGQAYGKLIGDGLLPTEAMNINGEHKTTLADFKKRGPVDKRQWAMSYGSFHLPHKFGNCLEDGYYTCTELRQAAESQEFGKVFGWTAAVGDHLEADQLVDIANVDGLIYGFKLSEYKDEKDPKKTAENIKEAVAASADRYIAKKGEYPW